MQAVHTASSSGWAAPVAAAVFVGAGATYYFSGQRTPMAGGNCPYYAATIDALIIHLCACAHEPS